MASKYENILPSTQLLYEMKGRLSIYNLNGKEARWWRDFKHTKKDEVREI